jgi:hypothetical protein
MFMTALRAKYIRDLAVRGRALRTQESYTSYVADLARFLDRSPRLDAARSPLDLIDLNRLGQPS